MALLFPGVACALFAGPRARVSDQAGSRRHPVRAGSGPDAALHLMAEQAGGNGFIAIGAFKQGAADGHDLVQLDNSHLTNHPRLFGKLPFDAERDFTPLRMLLRAWVFVAVAADSPYKAIDDIVAAARAQPGELSHDPWFNGNPGHLDALKLCAMTGVQMTHVPYRDFGQLYAAVSSREVDWALASVANAGAMERAGKLRFIAHAAPARDPLDPNVPSTAESPGSQGFEVSGWTALAGPRGVAPSLQQQLSSDIAAALAAPEVMERHRSLGYEAPALDPAALVALIQRESREWDQTVRAANLKLD